MADINVDVNVLNATDVEVSSPSKSINAIINLPPLLSSTVTSPTQALATNISIPGPQGPRGEKGNPTSINSLTAENIIITGADGNIVYTTGLNTIFISGNSGYFQKLIDNLFLQAQTISGNLEVLGSGFFLSGIKVGTGTVFIEPNKILINGDLVITKSGLDAVSGYFENENTIGYSHPLTPGNDNYFVNYPNVLISNPRSVNCVFQNAVDDILYYFSISGVNKTGFHINFSDTLDNNGYFLNINVKK